MIERLEHSDGLSAILPAMANSAMALKCLGYGLDHPLMKEQLAHIDGLLLRVPPMGRCACSPAFRRCGTRFWPAMRWRSPVRRPDHPGLRAGRDLAAGEAVPSLRRLGASQRRRPGGWYFEHRNEFYPDVDDTCMALMVLCHARSDEPEAAQQTAIERGLTWMLGMQNSDGGWGSFDRDNDKHWLTQVPFADHNAMIDPSTADITARVLECLARFPGSTSHPVVQRALDFLRRDQASDGCWYGRWGVNYLYGTWQVLRGLRCIGEDMQSPVVRRAVRWLSITRMRTAVGERASPATTMPTPARRGTVNAQSDRLGVDGSAGRGRGGQPCGEPRRPPSGHHPGRRRDLAARVVDRDRISPRSST